MRHHRRQFLAASAGLFASGLISSSVGANGPAERPASKNDRPGIGVVGLRYQGSVIADKARVHGDIVALADVDRHVREQARASFGGTPLIFEDYRKMLDRKDVDVVLIASPDHWHTKMAIDACRAGKDVYIEKPLTLTVDEGKTICRVVKETGRVAQVGSWQRSDAYYRLAVEMIRAGRLGKLRKVTCAIGKNPVGGPFPVRPVPGHLNWNLWLGQAPRVPYIEQRCHYTFRWWRAYAGGKVTDWGAHHLDIAQWAIGACPIEVDAEGELPDVENAYDVAKRFRARIRYPGDCEVELSDTGRIGLLFEGDKGRLFVSRGTLQGLPVERLREDPLPREQFKLYPHDNADRPDRYGKLEAIINHMGNFFDCVRTRKTPISDVESQHRSAATCHLVNISLGVGRPLVWNAEEEQFEGDSEANSHLKRKQRKGFEVA